MGLINPEKKIQKIISAVCFSLFIHAGAGTLLIFSPSNNPIFPPRLTGLNFVWASLGAKNNGIAIEGNLPYHEAYKEKTPATDPSEPKDQNSPPKTAPIFAALESTGPIKSVNYEGYNGEATKEQAAGTNQAAGGISRSGAVTAYPLYGENLPPVYPEIARVRGYEGVVFIAVQILPNGCVGNVKIRKSSGYAILDQSALEGVKPWKFEPARKAGKPFTIWVEVPIKFVLHNDNSQS